MSKENFLSLNILALKICSLYPSRHDAGRFEKFMDIAYKVINTVCLYFAAIPPLYEIYLREKIGITSYCMDIVNSCSYICTIVTIHFFHINGNVVRDMITEMNNLFKFKSTGIVDKDMSENDKITRRITIVFFALTTCAVTMMGILPLFSKSEERLLPVPGRYPFTYTESPYYEIIYLIQMQGQIIMGALTGAGDSFFMCMVLTTAAQFDVLANDFHNCVFNTLLQHGISKEDIVNFIVPSENLQKSLLKKEPSEKRIATTEINKRNSLTNNNSVSNIINSESFTVELNKLFISYIKHHQKLLDFCAKTEQFLWPFIFMKTSVNMFYNIFFIFALVMSTDDISLELILAQYELCALMELLIYSVTGQAIITKSEALREQLYSSPWYFCDKKHRKLVFMVLMRSSRAVRISVGKLYDLSHATFIMVLKAAMSYLAVLQQVID